MAVLAGQIEFSSKNLSVSDYFVYEATDTYYPNYQEFLSTLQACFGINATQDFNNLYINKIDLSFLTAQTDNKAESLLVALLLHIEKYFLKDELDKIEASRLASEFVNRKGALTRQDIILIDLYAKPHYEYGLSVINPATPLSSSDF